MNNTKRSRSLSICLTDIPRERIQKHSNGKLYLNLSTYDYDQPDTYGNDFSVSLPLTPEEIEAKKAGKQVNRVFLGSGKIWESSGMQPATQEDIENLGF